MKVLITSGSSDIAGLLHETLNREHSVVLTDDPSRSSAENCIACVLGHDEATDQLCEGVDAIVLVCTSDGLSESSVIDVHSRKIYNLLTAALEAGVKHVVMISSLSLFDAVDPAYEIDEQWAPSVTTDPEVLRYHVAEFVCREFARANRLAVTCLRTGDVVDSNPGDSDVTRSGLGVAVSAALSQGGTGWSVYHVVSAGDRFSTDKIQKGLDVDPGRTV